MATYSATPAAAAARVPLASLSWADGAEMWNFMVEKDDTYSKLRSERILDQHPSLVHNHRTILLDWISEVSQELKFHRETYHLALDFIDRYLAAQTDVGRSQLQLIGTTCLFLAAKYEEIRPPTVNEFADLTDGACRPEDIIDNEVVILSAINWDITPMTPNSWLNTFGLQLQLNFDEHKRIASLIDLALLHLDTLKFSNSILTAAAIYHFTNEQLVTKSTGYTYTQLFDCIHWLEPFALTIKAIKGPIFMASCRGSESHPTQMHTHIATGALLEEAIARMYAMRQQSLKRKACCLDENGQEIGGGRNALSELDYLVVDGDDQFEGGDKRRRQETIACHNNQQHLVSVANGTEISGHSPSPLKPFTTALLTPPSSTSKSRRKRFREDTDNNSETTQTNTTTTGTTNSTPKSSAETRAISTNTQANHVRSSFAHPRAC